MTDEDQLRSLVATWRKSQDSLYASVMQAPSLYMGCIRLVRATADQMAGIEDAEGLLKEFREGDPDLVASVADDLELPQLEFLDFDQVRNAAFYLRYQEIAGTRYQTEVQQKVAEARASGSDWVVLHEETTRARGRSYTRRLEMHLPDGFALYTGSELDWERGRIYVVEPMSLDPESGQPRRDDASPTPRQEFATQEEMSAAAEALRAKHSTEFPDSTRNHRHVADGGGPNG